MKIKLFEFNDYQLLEEAVNEFIKDKKIIDIKFSATADSHEHNSYLALVMLE